MAPTWSSSEILGSARLSYPRSWAGAPVSRISASCLPLPWTCSITYSPHRSITPSSASSRPIPNRLSSFVTNLDIWPSTNSRRTSSIRLSPSATARSVPPSSPPTHRSDRYPDPALLICDELGYLALDQQSSNLFYQVISIRHSQKRSTIITTNTPFSDWGNILFNTTIATAIADRLVENSEIFLFGGDSLRKPKNPN